MRPLILIAFTMGMTGCAPSWPAKEFPAEAKVERTLFAEAQFGLREGCEAMVVELTDTSATRLLKIRKSRGVVEIVPPAGWNLTPMPPDPNAHDYYQGAFGGCTRGGDTPLGDLPGWLERPGAFYKVINGGEGVAIIVPHAKLAGFYYSG